MRTNQPLLVTLIIIAFTASNTMSQQNHLEAEGHVKIRGNMDINHMDDTTSVLIGRNAGVNTDFSSLRSNTFVGSNAGFSNTIGFLNSFFGGSTGVYNTTGFSNSFFGAGAGFFNMTGSFNSFFGESAGFNNTTGNKNSFFGGSAGLANTIGNDNSFFGESAGILNYTGTRNTFIGYQASQSNSLDSLDRAAAIGYNARVDCSHCMVLGGTGEDTVRVGIGTSNPTAILDVRGTTTVGIPGDGNTLLILNSERSWAFKQSQTGSQTKLELVSIGGGGNKHFVINTTGGVGIGNLIPNDALDVIGDIDATGCIQTDNSATIGGTCLSDKRLKKNIVTLDPQLSNILSLTPVRFEWKDPEINGGEGSCYWSHRPGSGRGYSRHGCYG